MQIGFIAILQFLIDPLQYFFITPFYTIPGIYLGRLLTFVLVSSLIASPKKYSHFLFSSYKYTLLSKPYWPFAWLSLMAAIPLLLSGRGFACLVRFGIIEPLTSLSYIALLTILPSLISTNIQRIRLSSLLYPFWP